VQSIQDWAVKFVAASVAADAIDVAARTDGGLAKLDRRY